VVMQRDVYTSRSGHALDPIGSTRKVQLETTHRNDASSRPTPRESGEEERKEEKEMHADGRSQPFP